DGLRMAFEDRLEGLAADAPEAVDADAGHACSFAYAESLMRSFTIGSRPIRDTSPANVVISTRTRRAGAGKARRSISARITLGSSGRLQPMLPPSTITSGFRVLTSPAHMAPIATQARSRTR